MSQALLAPERSEGGVVAPLAAQTGSAVSEESRAVREAVESIRKSVEKSQALFGGKAAAIGRVWALVNECSDPGWDGDGADPVDRLAAFRAADVIRALPPRVPFPEVTPEPDGAISLDWIRSRNQLFSLTVGSGDRLAFAWLNGSDRGHGVVRFGGQAIPNPILHGIDEILGHGGTTLGPA
jgi:hypothetical protein